MDEETQKPEPKITEVEIVIIGLFFVVLDLIDLIPIAGDITDIVAAPMGFYYWMKGINGTIFIVSEILDAIPVVQEFPSRTVGWGIAVWLDRHPKIEAKFATAIAIGAALEGNVESAGGDAAKASALGAEGKATVESGAGAMSKAGNTEMGTGTEMSGDASKRPAGSENARPSETSTERGRTTEDARKSSERSDATIVGQSESQEQGRQSEEGGIGEGEGGDQQETEEERRKREKDEEIAAMMETEAQKPIEEILIPKYFELQENTGKKKSDLAEGKETESQRWLRERNERQARQNRQPSAPKPAADGEAGRKKAA